MEKKGKAHLHLMKHIYRYTIASVVVVAKYECILKYSRLVEARLHIPCSPTCLKMPLMGLWLVIQPG